MPKKRRAPAPLHLDVLTEIRKALRALRRAERFMVAQERRQRHRRKPPPTKPSREELAEQG